MPNAEHQARELSYKGISTKIIKIQVEEKTMYRLIKEGFNRENEARKYADDMKKKLNLYTVLAYKISQ